MSRTTMNSTKNLKDQGFSLRGGLPWLLAFFLAGGAIILVWAPTDGSFWSGVKIVAAMLQMLCMGIVIAYNAPIWEQK